MDRGTIRGFAARRETPGLAFDLADLARSLIKDLFDTYRPELHYMRGPGPKWRDRHERTLRSGPDIAALTPVGPDHARVWLLTSICHAASVILGIALFVGVLLFLSPTASKADELFCAQVPDLAAARLRWAAARQSSVDSGQNEKKCRAYRFHFYDAVPARHAASICEDGITVNGISICSTSRLTPSTA